MVVVVQQFGGGGVTGAAAGEQESPTVQPLALHVRQVCEQALAGPQPDAEQEATQVTPVAAPTVHTPSEQLAE